MEDPREVPEPRTPGRDPPRGHRPGPERPTCGSRPTVLRREPAPPEPRRCIGAGRLFRTVRSPGAFPSPTQRFATTGSVLRLHQPIPDTHQEHSEFRGCRMMKREFQGSAHVPPDRARERIEGHLEATEAAPTQGIPHGNEEYMQAQEGECGKYHLRYTGKSRPPKSAIQPTGKPSVFMIAAATHRTRSSFRPAVEATPDAQSGRLFRLCGRTCGEDSGGVEYIGPPGRTGLVCAPARSLLVLESYNEAPGGAWPEQSKVHRPGQSTRVWAYGDGVRE